MEIQGECPEFTNDDEIFMQNFRTSDGKSLQDLINLRTNSTKGSMKGGGGACQYTVAVVLSLVAAGASYFVIANTLASASIDLETINNAKANLEVIMNQSCSTMERSAATALAKYNGFSPVDCTDYHAQVAKLAVSKHQSCPAKNLQECDYDNFYHSRMGTSCKHTEVRLDIRCFLQHTFQSHFLIPSLELN